jgi:hypothetical protein
MNMPPDLRIKEKEQVQENFLQTGKQSSQKKQPVKPTKARAESHVSTDRTSSSKSPKRPFSEIETLQKDNSSTTGSDISTSHAVHRQRVARILEEARRKASLGGATKAGYSEIPDHEDNEEGISYASASVDAETTKGSMNQMETPPLCDTEDLRPPRKKRTGRAINGTQLATRSLADLSETDNLQSTDSSSHFTNAGVKVTSDPMPLSETTYHHQGHGLDPALSPVEAQPDPGTQEHDLDPALPPPEAQPEPGPQEANLDPALPPLEAQPNSLPEERQQARPRPPETVVILDESDDEIEILKVKKGEQPVLPPGVDTATCTHNPVPSLVDMICASKAIKSFLCINEIQDEQLEWKLVFFHQGREHFCILPDQFVRDLMDESEYEMMVKDSTSAAFRKLCYDSESLTWTTQLHTNGTHRKLDEDYVRSTFRPEFLDQVETASLAGKHSFLNILPWCRIFPPVASEPASDFISRTPMQFRQYDHLKECKLVCAIASAVYEMGKKKEAMLLYKEGVHLPSNNKQVEKLSHLIRKHLRGYRLEKVSASNSSIGSSVTIKDEMPLIIRPKLASNHLTCLLTIYGGKIFEPTLERALYHNMSKHTLDICCGGTGQFLGIAESWKLVDTSQAC